jgi:hypothetical protein
LVRFSLPVLAGWCNRGKKGRRRLLPGDGEIDRLVDANIVEEVLFSEDRRQSDLPYKFYGINESSRQFLEEHNLLRAQDTLREIYDRVEKTDNINRYELLRDPSPEHYSAVS